MPETSRKTQRHKGSAEIPETPSFPRKTWDSSHLDVRFLHCATVAELVYAQDLGSCEETHEGSSPSGRMTGFGLDRPGLWFLNTRRARWEERAPNVNAVE